MDRPDCKRCSGTNTTYYKHTFEGGWHVGLYCWTCRTHAEAARQWYPRNWFGEDDLAAMPKLEDLTKDPRQGDLF